MAKAHSSAAMWKARILAELQRDKKKAVILGVLFLITVTLFGKMLLKGSPAPAAADKPAGASPSDSQGGPENDAPKSPPIGRGLPDSVTDRAVIPENLSDMITRDIFRPDEKSFPLVKPDKAKVIKPKTGSKRVTDKEAKQKQIQAEADELHLESTLTGRRPIAIINGKVVPKDGLIAGFRVAEISLRSCVVEKDGVRLELTMDK